ncbi:hypothetical protein ABZY90_33130 [Streptomyces sp. NPDC006422]|uniref:hypothetical protein n=1 Tax=unclassified Streptomyces TaxID=2593676 RepID=UPI0033BD6D26
MTHGDGQQDVPTGGFGAPPPPFAPAPPAAPPAAPPPPSYAPGAPPAPPAPPAGPGGPGGPEFVAADKHNGVVVDAEGLHFEQGPHAIDLPWSHVRTANFQPMPSGVFVTASMSDGAVYTCQVQARKKAQASEWCGQLGAVLQHYLQGRA